MTDVPNRPLSPHLQIYGMRGNMLMSIVHRITGAALYGGSALLALWLIAAAFSPDAFALVNGLLASWLGQLVLVGFTWAVLHHLVGGLRYLIWDTGTGFELPTINLMSWGTLVLSLLLTAAVWAAALFW
jgi:succinate dehydrogenase / fumarate reductase, cytochrome b subunit